MRVTVINEKRKLHSWKRVHWQSRCWSTSFWSRLARLGHSLYREAQSSTTGILRGFHAWLHRGSTAATIQLPVHWHPWTVSHGWWERPHNCPFSITQYPTSSNNCLHGKAALHVSLQEVTQDSKAQSTSFCQRLPLSPWQGGRGTYSVKLFLPMPWPAELHHHLTRNPLR